MPNFLGKSSQNSFWAQNGQNIYIALNFETAYLTEVFFKLRKNSLKITIFGTLFYPKFAWAFKK
jgi:hypothetical protein